MVSPSAAREPVVVSIRCPVYPVLLDTFISPPPFSNDAAYKWLGILLYETFLTHFIFLDPILHMVKFQASSQAQAEDSVVYVQAT